MFPSLILSVMDDLQRNMTVVRSGLGAVEWGKERRDGRDGTGGDTRGGEELGKV